MSATRLAAQGPLVFTALAGSVFGGTISAKFTLSIEFDRWAPEIAGSDLSNFYLVLKCGDKEYRERLTCKAASNMDNDEIVKLADRLRKTALAELDDE